MIEFLKKAKRALVAWRVRVKTRREASRAFRYDRRQWGRDMPEGMLGE